MPYLPLSLQVLGAKLKEDVDEYDESMATSLIRDPVDIPAETHNLYTQNFNRLTEQYKVSAEAGVLPVDEIPDYEEIANRARELTDYQISKGTTAGRAGQYLAPHATGRSGEVSWVAAMDQAFSLQSLTPGVGAVNNPRTNPNEWQADAGGLDEYLKNLVLSGAGEAELSAAEYFGRDALAKGHKETGWFADLFSDPYMNVVTGDIGVYENSTMRTFRAITTVGAFGSEAVQELGVAWGQHDSLKYTLPVVGPLSLGLEKLGVLPETTAADKEEFVKNLGGRTSEQDLWYTNYLVRSLDRACTLNGFAEVFQETVEAGGLNMRWDEESQKYVNVGHVPGSQLLTPFEPGFVGDLFWVGGFAFDLFGTAEKIVFGGPTQVARTSRAVRTASMIEADFKAAGVVIDPQLKRHVINVMSDPSKGVLDLADSYSNEWLRFLQEGIDPNVLFKNMPEELQRAMDELAMDAGIRSGVVTKNFGEWAAYVNDDYIPPAYVPTIKRSARKAQEAAQADLDLIEQASKQKPVAKVVETTEDILEGTTAKPKVAKPAKPQAKPKVAKPVEPDTSRVDEVIKSLKNVTETTDAKIAEVKTLEQKLAKITKSNAKLEKAHGALIKSHRNKIKELTKQLKKAPTQEAATRIQAELDDTMRALQRTEEQMKGMAAGTEPGMWGYQEMLKAQILKVEDELAQAQATAERAAAFSKAREGLEAGGVEPAFSFYKARVDKLSDELEGLTKTLDEQEKLQGVLDDLAQAEEGADLLRADLKAIESSLDEIADGAKEGTPVQRVEAFIAKQAKLKEDLRKANKELDEAKKEGPAPELEDKIANLEKQLQDAEQNTRNAEAAARLNVNIETAVTKAISEGAYDSVTVVWFEDPLSPWSQPLKIDPEWSWGQSMGRIVSLMESEGTLAEASLSADWYLIWRGTNEETLQTIFKAGPQHPITAAEYMLGLKGKGATFVGAHRAGRVLSHETPMESGGIHYTASGEEVFVNYFPDEGIDYARASLDDLKALFKDLKIEEPQIADAAKADYVEALEEWIPRNQEQWAKKNPVDFEMWKNPNTFEAKDSSRLEKATKNLLRATRIRKYFVHNEGGYLSLPMTLEEAAKHFMERALTPKGLKKWEKGKKIEGKDFQGWQRRESMEGYNYDYWRDEIITSNPTRNKEFKRRTTPTRVLAGWRKEGGGKKHGTLSALRNQHLTPVEARLLFREKSGVRSRIADVWYPGKEWVAGGRLGRSQGPEKITWGLLMDEAGTLPVIPSKLRNAMKKAFDDSQPKVDKGGSPEDIVASMLLIDPIGILGQKTLAKMTPAKAHDILSGAPFAQWLWRKRYFRTRKPMAKPRSEAEKEILDLLYDSFAMYFNTKGPHQKVVDVGQGVYVPANIAKDLVKRAQATIKDEFGISWKQFWNQHSDGGKLLHMDAETAKRLNHLFDEHNSKVRVGEIDGKWTLEYGAWSKAYTDVVRSIGGKWTSQAYAMRDTGFIENFAHWVTRVSEGNSKKLGGKGQALTSILNGLWQFQKYTVPKNVRMKFRRMVGNIQNSEEDIRRVLRQAKKEGKDPVEALARLYAETPGFVTKAQLIRVQKWRELKNRRATLKEGEISDWMAEANALRKDILLYVGDPTATASVHLKRGGIIIGDEDALVKALDEWSGERSSQIVDFVKSFGAHAYSSIPGLSRKAFRTNWKKWDIEVQTKLNNKETAELVYQELLHSGESGTLERLTEFNRVTEGVLDSPTLLKSKSSQIASAVTGVMVERLQRARYQKGILHLAEDLDFSVSKQDAAAVYKYIYQYDSEFLSLPVDVQSNAIKAVRGLGFDAMPNYAFDIGKRGATGKKAGLTALKIGDEQMWLPEWAATELSAAMKEGLDIRLSRRWKTRGGTWEGLVDMIGHNSTWWNFANRAGKTLMTHGFVPLIRLNYYLTNAFGMVEMALGRQSLASGAKQVGRAAYSGMMAPLLSKMGVRPRTADALPQIVNHIDSLVAGKNPVSMNRVYVAKDGRVFDYDALAQEWLTRGVTDTYSNLVGKADVAMDLQKGIRKDMEKAEGLFKTPQAMKDLGWNAAFTARSYNRWFNDGLRKIEVHFRGAAFLNALDDGFSLAEAADVARKSQLDFGDLTSFEKGVVKKYVLFYTFFRRQYATYLRLMLENPNKMLAVHKLQAKQPDLYMSREQQAMTSRYNLQGLMLGTEDLPESADISMKQKVAHHVFTTGPSTFDIGVSLLTSMLDMASLLNVTDKEVPTDRFRVQMALEHEIGGKMSPPFKLTYDMLTAVTGNGTKEFNVGAPQWMAHALPQFTTTRPATPKDNPDYVYYNKFQEPEVVEATPFTKVLLNQLGNTPRQIQTYAEVWKLATDPSYSANSREFNALTLRSLIAKRFHVPTQRDAISESTGRTAAELKRIKEYTDQGTPQPKEQGNE